MKGKIISQIIHESTWAFAHGAGQRIRRLIVGGWALTHHNGAVHVFPWQEPEADPSLKVVSEEVEVPDHIIQFIENYLANKELLHKTLEWLGCSEEAQAQRVKHAGQQWREWSDAERAKGVTDLVYDSKKFEVF